MSTTLEFVPGSRIERQKPVKSALPLVRNGPPATWVVFADRMGIGVPTDQIVTAQDAAGAAHVQFGGMRFDGEDGTFLVFRRESEVRPEHELMPERGRELKIERARVARVLSGDRVLWP